MAQRRSLPEALHVNDWSMQAVESVCSSRAGQLADSLRMQDAALRSFALRNSTELMEGPRAGLQHRSFSTGICAVEPGLVHKAGMLPSLLAACMSWPLLQLTASQAATHLP